MNGFAPSYFAHKAKRKAYWRTKLANMRAAKERKRLERADTEPPRVDVRGKLVKTITIHDRIDGTVHTLDLRIGTGRINRYAVAMDGKLWREVSATALTAMIRKRLAVRWMEGRE